MRSLLGDGGLDVGALGDLGERGEGEDEIVAFKRMGVVVKCRSSSGTKDWLGGRRNDNRHGRQDNSALASRLTVSAVDHFLTCPHQS